MILKIYGYSDDVVQYDLLDHDGNVVWSEESSGSNCHFLLTTGAGELLGIQAAFSPAWIPGATWSLSTHFSTSAVNWPWEITVTERRDGEPVMNLHLPSDRKIHFQEVPARRNDSREGMMSVTFTPTLKITEASG